MNLFHGHYADCRVDVHKSLDGISAEDRQSFKKLKSSFRLSVFGKMNLNDTNE